MTNKCKDQVHEIMEILRQMKPIERKIVMAAIMCDFCGDCGRNYIHKACNCEKRD